MQAYAQRCAASNGQVRKNGCRLDGRRMDAGKERIVRGDTRRTVPVPSGRLQGICTGGLHGVCMPPAWDNRRRR